MMLRMEKHVTPIPPKIKHPGLKIRCTKCDTYVTKKCLENGKDLAACCSPERLEYRSVIHVPGTKHGRRVKTHHTTNLNEAIIAHLQFEEEVKAAGLPTRRMTAVFSPAVQQHTVPLPVAQPVPLPTLQTQPHLLVEWAARFVAFMRDVDVPNHLKQKLSGEYLEEIEREIKRMCVCLARHFDLATYSLEQLDDTAVGYVCDYLVDVKKYANRTFNKHMTTYSAFYEWWQKKTRQAGENFFRKVAHKKTELDPETIDNREEFEQLITILTPERGIQLSGGKKHKRILYKPWLEKAFRIGLESGVRRENLVYLSTEDIIEDETGPIVMRIENLKVNKLMHIAETADRKLIYVPLTHNLKELIIADYKDYKRTGKNRFLVAPDRENREVMADDISRAFSHYYRQLNTGKELKFGALRKKYITEMEIFTGGRAEEVTGHSNDRVLRHYRVPKLIAKAAREFQVYRKEDSREEEMRTVRRSAASRKNKRSLDRSL